MSNEKCFCHLNGYAVKDATARVLHKRYTKITPTLASGVTGSIECRYNSFAVHIGGRVKLVDELGSGKSVTVASNINIPEELKPHLYSQYSVTFYQNGIYVVKLDTSANLSIRKIGEIGVFTGSGTEFEIHLSYPVEYSEDYLEPKQ